MKHLVATCLIILIAFSCTNNPAGTEGAKRQQPAAVKTTAALPPCEFAFADTTGKRLRALDHQEQPDSLTRAACPGKETLTIRFTGKKEGTQKNTGRDTAANFEAGGGFYYQILNGQTTADTVCLLTDERFFAGKTALPLLPGSEKPDASTKERIEKTKKRRVKEAWGMGRLAPDREFSLVLFERKDDQALFSIVMAAPSRLVFLDFPGSYEDEGSVWRVDDGGEIDPLFFDIVLVFETGQGIEFMYSWRGAEGESVGFVQEAGDVFRVIKSSYKYMSPL